MAARFQSFQEFWPFYLQEHSKPATRWFHFVGTTASFLVLALMIGDGRGWLAPVAFVPGYACAWISHFFIERNRPATFKYPLWSFVADLKMWAFMATGRIGAEVARHVRTS